MRNTLALLFLLTVNGCFAQITYIKEIESNENIAIQKIIKVSTGGYLLAGTVYENFPMRKSILIKLDDSFNSEWSQLYGPDSSYFQSTYNVIENPAGGYFVLGLDSVSSLNQSQGTLSYVDDFGVWQWTKAYGNVNTGFSRINELNILANGDVLMSGSINDTSAQTIYVQDSWMIRTDNNGNEIWQKQINELEDQQIRNGVLTDDGNYLTTGP